MSTYTNLLYHVVFSTKNRQRLITEDVQAELFRYLGGIIRGEGGIALEINGMPDHVHILMKLKPSMSLSDLMRKLKGNSSKWVNEKQLCSHEFGWQNGYAALTVSESQAPRVRQYIRKQQEHHRQTDFKAELLGILQRHRIEFDERYLWD
jgi:REP element-mobilizing transposase RayT